MQSRPRPRKRGGCSHPPIGDAESCKRPANCLTFTVEEAAQALGISRAFAYEAVARGEIPCIRIQTSCVPRTKRGARSDDVGSAF